MKKIIVILDGRPSFQVPADAAKELDLNVVWIASSHSGEFPQTDTVISCPLEKQLILEKLSGLGLLERVVWFQVQKDANILLGAQLNVSIGAMRPSELDALR